MEKLKTSVLVIGAGHAGIEAALASARMGIDTVIFTTNLDAVGNMPCNPSVGGSAKGHLVFEIDALGGEMGAAADAVTIQSRTLNLGKGAAVHSKRTQADRDAYKRYMKKALEKEPNLRLIQGQIVDIRTEELGGKKRVVGVHTHFSAERVNLTNNLPFSSTAYRRIARQKSNTVKIKRQHRRLKARSS